jgi:hypothetical protein
MSETKKNEGSQTFVQIQMQNKGHSDSTSKKTAHYANLDEENHTTEPS